MDTEQHGSLEQPAPEESAPEESAPEQPSGEQVSEEQEAEEQVSDELLPGDGPVSEEQYSDDELELAELEEEAALLELRAQRRSGGTRLRRALRIQAPVLVALALVMLLWGRSAPQTATAATPPPASPPLIGMSDAYLDPPASGTGPMYAYMTIRNNGGTPDRLVGASSPWAKSIDMESGTSTTAVPWITVPAHGSITLRTSTDRIALQDLTRAPKLGDTIQLDLNFATSGTVFVFAPVGPASSITVPDVVGAMNHMDALPPTTAPTTLTIPPK